MTQSLFILGRQPALGLAELESLYGAGGLQQAGSNAALLDRDPADINFSRLGGSIKLATVLDRIDGTGAADWNKLDQHLRRNLPRYVEGLGNGKLKLGLSVHGFTITKEKLGATGLSLKKVLRDPRNGGRSVRVVPNKELELNSAQVLHNNLTAENGCELLVVRAGTSTVIARTVAVQDIDAYAARDQGRPKRDARVGMLPPKLAQIIVNLAVGPTVPSEDSLLLDPFCGTGVVLQEAALMGYPVYGTDLEQRMVDFSAKNLEWLAGQHELAYPAPQLEAGDATNHHWHPVPAFVAGETYLGQPFSAVPTAEKLEQVRSNCNLIHRKFLQNIASQLPSGARLCLAVPAWQTRPGQFVRLSTLDHLEELGYNRMSFKHVETTTAAGHPANSLIYARPDQIVARELLVVIKK